MIIRLQQIGETPFQWRETVRVAAESIERPELIELGDVAWRGQVGRETGGYLLQAVAQYRQTLACSRCLRPVASEVEEEVELLLLLGAPEQVGGEHELEDEELRVVHLDGEELDTEPILREIVELNIPMRTLCREDCAGLCPVCGTDRNESPCSCDRSSADPRWSALEGLRHD